MYKINFRIKLNIKPIPVLLDKTKLLDVKRGRFYRKGDVFTTGKSGITGSITEIISIRPNLTKLRLDTGAGMRYAMVKIGK